MLPWILGAVLAWVVVQEVIKYKTGKAIGAGVKALLSWVDNPQAGKMWGSPDGLPEGWDPSQNSAYVDPRCEWAIEGLRFLPMTGMGAPDVPDGTGRADSLIEVLDYEGPGIPRGQNTAWGYVDELAAQGVDAKTIADSIFAEVAPLCWDAGPSAWGSGVERWYADLYERIRRRAGDA